MIHSIQKELVHVSTLVLICLLCAGKSNHMIENPIQPPISIINQIDSIIVDEKNEQINIFGSFDSSSSAIVLVDSVSLSKTVTSDSLIKANIP